jgi:hypothetical protein
METNHPQAESKKDPLFAKGFQMLNKKTAL